MKQLFGLRGRMLRSVLLASLLATLAGGVVLKRFWPALAEQPGPGLILPGALFFAAVLAVNSYFTFQESKRLRKRLHDVAAFTAVLSRGNLSYRMDVLQHDEIGRVTTELNRLAETMEQHVASLQRLADSNEELAGKVHSAAIIEERQRLARDLHDAVSQQLFALTMLSEATAAVMDAGGTPDREQIREVAWLAAQIQQEMRALLLHLRPVQLDGESLAEGLESLVDEIRKKSGLQFELSVQPLPSIARGVENHLFRVVQEALANILRHAEAGKATVHLFAKDGELFLQIADNGRGFDPTQQMKASYGLQTMRERCEEIGGRMLVTSRPGAGARIDIRVPIRGKEA